MWASMGGNVTSEGAIDDWEGALPSQGEDDWDPVGDLEGFGAYRGDLAQRIAIPSQIGGGVEEEQLATLVANLGQLLRQNGAGEHIVWALEELTAPFITEGAIVFKQEGGEDSKFSPPADSAGMPTEEEEEPVGSKRPLSMSAVGDEQHGDSGEEVTFQQEVVHIKEAIAERLEEDAGRLKDTRVRRAVQTMRVFHSTPGVTVVRSSNAKSVMGVDTIRVEERARRTLLKALESMVVTDVFKIWWKNSMSFPPKHITDPVYEVWRDVGLAPKRGKKPKDLDTHMFSEEYCYINDDNLVRMVSNSKKKKKARTA
ncbi:hypothetical protein T484DRAFT_1964769 [Baffinella frigidus]|nr:hypothetical protein T484DRAFT_1964769 [Cryptophyta sp. CCMP2293]